MAANTNSVELKRSATKQVKAHWLVRWFKRSLVALFLLFAGFFFFIWYANHAATRAGKGILYDDVADVPHRQAGLVFGCSEKLGSRDNLYFKYRIEAAAELWHAGKVDFLIVSGDNREKYYNEPVAMRKALVEAGVPFKKIVCDYAGLRTLDSVVRAKKVFGLNEVIFVSQKFQNERAAYIAKANGMDVLGYNAQDVEGYAARKTEDREVLARVKMWLDVNITDEQPRHLGDPEPVPE
ncbi:YdcF family protein [Verrucomicrobiaceae bacterium R5-34]|uniref:YdcF family protein n=1 Tax=Oceaniferula flava TaxID=2800421 RepID=A0AAE2V918_9BACT|nr:ElyC/SanA/YdcF family protein [Oceaniferula flavus]MBK1830321.1 YdcF family protein [Verrucomicrobiaceae bacterium R5-34]MBK1854413.1 YdcF family protein [Oceaniferula flavus]MBM1135719.1 YdcF family protein [Oceaniferula flavus]